VEIGLRDPRSQKRDLGHPSISPFAIAEGTSFVISLPTRLSESAARDDKKGTVVARKGQLLNRGFFRTKFGQVWLNSAQDTSPGHTRKHDQAP